MIQCMPNRTHDKHSVNVNCQYELVLSVDLLGAGCFHDRLSLRGGEGLILGIIEIVICSGSERLSHASTVTKLPTAEFRPRSA